MRQVADDAGVRTDLDRRGDRVPAGADAPAEGIFRVGGGRRSLRGRAAVLAANPLVAVRLS